MTSAFLYFFFFFLKLENSFKDEICPTAKAAYAQNTRWDPLGLFLIPTPLVLWWSLLIVHFCQMQDKPKDLTHSGSHCRNSAALLFHVLFQRSKKLIFGYNK